MIAIFFTSMGGCDGLLFALILFVAVDYVTGVMCAVSDRELSSAVCFKGICRKVLIFILVGIGNVLDVHIIGTDKAKNGKCTGVGTFTIVSVKSGKGATFGRGKLKSGGGSV